jgi:hypothetical protein
MNESHITGLIASALQFLVAGYALRLNRRYGTRRVGWSLCCAFALLALLQLVQSTSSFHTGSDSALKINVIYALISFLLLIGMVHLEAMLNEQGRRERGEQELRAGLESEVKSKTAHLTRAIEELMCEMAETKRMAAIIETSHWTKIDNVAEILAEAVVKPAVALLSAGDDYENEEVYGSMGGELLAHF